MQQTKKHVDLRDLGMCDRFRFLCCWAAPTNPFGDEDDENEWVIPSRWGFFILNVCFLSLCLCFAWFIYLCPKLQRNDNETQEYDARAGFAVSGIKFWNDPTNLPYWIMLVLLLTFPLYLLVLPRCHGGCVTRLRNFHFPLFQPFLPEVVNVQKRKA